MIRPTIQVPADVAERVLVTGLSADDAAWIVGRHTPDPTTGLRRSGTSSNALAWHAAAGRPVTDDEAPRDPSDLAACYLTWASAPARHRLRMETVLAGWAARVAERYDMTELVDRPGHLGPLPGLGASGTDVDGQP